MIVLERVDKVRKAYGAVRRVLSAVDVRIPSDRRIALFGNSNEDTSLIIDLLAGIQSPTSGHIRRAARVSFPVGYAGGLQGELSLLHNIAHVARLYGADPSSVVDFMRNIAGLRDVLHLRFRDLPTSLKRQFAQVLSYSIPFDVYLLNVEPTRVPIDHREIACALFEARTRFAGAIVATRDFDFARKHCHMALSILGEKLVLFDDVDQAISVGQRQVPLREIGSVCK